MDEIDKDISLEEEARSQNTSKERLRELATLNDDLTAIVANNVSAPSDLLEELVSHNDKAVRKAVISNPNSSLETLFKLGAQYFPQELLNNPIFQLSDLENSDFINNIPFYTLHALLQLEDVPKFVLNHARKGYQRQMVIEALQMHVAIAGEMTEEWHEAAEKKANYQTYQAHYFDFLQRWNLDFEFLSYFMEFVPKKLFEDPFFRMALASNTQTPPKILEQLAQDKSRFMRACVAGNKNTPAHVLRELADYSVVETREAVANNKNAPINALKKLAKDKTDRIRETVARNENTPVNVLKILAEDKNDTIRNIVAFRWNTSASILQYLSEDPVIEIRQSVSYNMNAGLKTLQKLSVDENTEIRSRVAGNRNTPASILEQLSTDENVQVLERVAENKNTPEFILDKLARNKDSLVRMGLARNPNLPLEIAKKLMNDKDSQVRKNFLSYLNNNPPIKILEEFAVHPNEYLRKLVADNAKTPVYILETLAIDENYMVRETVAKNKNTPPYVLEQLVNDKNDMVRAGVAQRKNLPHYIFEQLALDKHFRVLYEIAINSNTPTKILEILVSDRENDVDREVVENSQCTLEIKETIFKNLAQREKPSFLRYVLFLSNYAKSSVLAENSNSVSWLERYAIAQNQKTPEETLKQLAQDGNRIVRATAKESLQKYY